MVTREQIEQFIVQNRRVLPGMEYYYTKDTNQDRFDDWDRAKLKVLVVFGSTGETRSVSNTFTCLNLLLHEGSKEWTDIFVDNCYMPEAETRDALIKAGLPLVIGSASHLPWSEYDVLIYSHAIMPECINVPFLWNSSGIPLASEERDEANAPLIFYGGAAAGGGFSILGGHIKDHGHGLYDVGNVGAGEVTLPTIAKTLAELGKDIKTHRKDAIDALLASDVKDYLIIPKFWDVKINPENHFDVLSFEKLDPRMPDRIKVGRIYTPNYFGFYKKIFGAAGGNARSSDVQISSGCSGNCCSFCSEGQEAGRWTEKEFEQVLDDLKKTRKFSAPNTIGAFSFNLNYYKSVFDLFHAEAEMFSNLSMINQRFDVIAAAPEYLDLAKKMGLKRISCAIEGAGPRMRNHILNKNLSSDQMRTGFRNICNQKLIMCKFGMIRTGLETDEDWREFEEELDSMIAIREEVGANTALQMNFTPLVFYNTIPLRWMPRGTAKESFYEERNMKPFLEWARSRGIRTKVNGRGPGTYIEQLLLDLGFAGSTFLCDVSINEHMVYERHFSSADKERVLRSLEKVDIDPTIIFPERPLDYVFSADLIEFTTPANIELWKEQHKKRDFSSPLCLKTPANLSPKCRDCGMCPTPETKKQHLTRAIQSKKTVDDIHEALSLSKPKGCVKLVVQLRPGYEIYSKDMLSHYITSLFFREDDDLAEAFYAVSKNSCSWTSNNGQKGWFGGTFAFDIQFRRPMSAAQLKPYLEKINSILEVCQIKDIRDSDLNLEPSNTDSILYVGNIKDVSMARLKDKLSMFDWGIKVATKGMGSGLETEVQSHPELKDKILFVQNGSNILCSMVLPANISPYLVLSSILGKSPDYCYANSLFNIMDSGTKVDATCGCGSSLVMSHQTGKVSSLCQNCLAKRYLYKQTHS